MIRCAKIVCTLGPASHDVGSIEALLDAGMDVARLNASHGTPDSRREVIDRLRLVGGRQERPLAVALDLPGPEVRTAAIEERVSLAAGSTVELVAGEGASPERVGLSADITAVEAGDCVLVDDGRLELRV